MPAPAAQLVDVEADRPTQLLDSAIGDPTLIVNTDPVATVFVAATATATGGSSRVPLSPGRSVRWPAGVTAYARTDAGSAAVIVLPGGDGMAPTAAEIAESIGTVTLTLGPNSQVIVEGAQSTTSQDVGQPNFSTRNVSASSSVTGEIVSTSTTPSGTLTVIAAPAGGKKLELHQVWMSISSTTNVNGAVCYCTVEDLTTGANIAEVSVQADANAGNTARAALAIDLQGVTLPAGHGVRLRLSTDGTNLGAGVKTIATLGVLTYGTVI